jgi:vitamin B12 transporter
LIVVGFGLVVVGPRSVCAQQPRDTTALDPLIVTAERLPTVRSASSATVTVITAKDLRERGIRRLLDALRDVAGLDIAQTGSYGGSAALFLRGGESDYVKVLVDGVPVNDPGGAVDLADLTTDNVERIEIVRGPVSVLYGSDAVSGVVQVFTRRGRGGARGEVSMRAGSYTALEAVGDISGGTDVVGYALSASHARTDGIYAFNNEYRNIVWSGVVNTSPDERTTARLALRYADSRYHFPTDGAGREGDQNAFQRRNRVIGALELSRHLAPALEAQLLMSVHAVDGGIDDRPDGLSDTLGFFAYNSVQAVTRRSAELRINAFVTASSGLTAGVQLEEEQERSAANSQSAFGQESSSFDVERRNLGYYVQFRSSVVSGVGVTIGARIDDNDAFGTFLSARGGVVYRMTSSTGIRVSVGRAFKEPSFFENFADAPFARGNPDLRPERALSWEVGLEHALLDQRVRIAATYFDQRFRDLIQYTFAPPDPADPTYYNVAAANARGLEVELGAKVAFGLQIMGAYTYLRTAVIDAGFDSGAGAPFVSGARLLRRPTHALSVTATQRMSRRAHATAVLRYVGNRADRDFTAGSAEPVALPGYLVVDVAARATVWRGGAGRPSLDVTARVRNLFDVSYQEVFGFRTPGRTVLLGASAGI